MLGKILAVIFILIAIFVAWNYDLTEYAGFMLYQ